MGLFSFNAKRSSNVQPTSFNAISEQSSPVNTRLEAPPRQSFDMVDVAATPTKSLGPTTGKALVEPRRGREPGQGCYVSDDRIIAPLCGTCLDFTDGAHGCACFCVPICISD